MTTESAVELLSSFGTVTVIDNSDELEKCVILTVNRPTFSIQVTMDDCSQPRFQGWENGNLVIDTRDDLEACLNAFND